MTDVQYNRERSLITMVCELPGVKKDNVHVTLANNTRTGHREISVFGEVQPRLMSSDGVYLVRQRPLGTAFARVFPVSSDTQVRFLSASLSEALFDRVSGLVPLQFLA